MNEDKDRPTNIWQMQAQARLKRMATKVLRVAILPLTAFRYLCTLIGFLTIMSTIVFSMATKAFFNSLPELESYSYQDLKIQAEKRIRKNLKDGSQKYRWVKIDEVSREFLYSIVMSEDSGFFEHEGIDYIAVVDSIALNFRKRRFATGGSTISQQTTKNLFLTQEKALTRKLREFFITKDFEAHFTKNEILELYLNLAEFGPDIYGVRAASHKFFNKKPAEVNAAEGAFLALMLPSPRRNHYSIFINQNVTRQKKRKIRRVLADMLDKEFITAKQYKTYNRYNFFKKNNFVFAAK